MQLFADALRLCLWNRQPHEALMKLPSCCRATVTYTGRVQGVGFRYMVKSLSPGFDATGTIQNLPSGQVALVLEGEKKELEAFMDAVRDSGLGPMIRDEHCEWSEAEGQLKGFEIIR